MSDKKSEFRSKFHVIKLNREADIDLKNKLFIDEKEIFGVMNVNIDYGLDNRNPIVIIQLVTEKVDGKIKSNIFDVLEGKP